MAERIYISKSDFQRLRALVDRHVDGRDSANAELLDAELERATVVDPGELPEDVVTVDSRVSFEEAKTGTVRDVVLAFPGSADPGAGRISVLAPVGAALLGLRRGDSIEWPLPDGRKARFRILAVRQPAPHGSAA